MTRRGAAGDEGVDEKEWEVAQGFVKLCLEDLPAVSISPMRAAGTVSKDDVSTVIRFGDGDVEFAVGVTHVRFPNGGDWARFACPGCGRAGRKLWLFDGAPRCFRCCFARGVGARAWPIGQLKRAEASVARLSAKLAGVARSNPRPGRRLDHRDQLENELRLAQLVLKRHRLKGVKRRKAGDHVAGS
jgi:hypothetical protein